MLILIRFSSIIRISWWTAKDNRDVRDVSPLLHYSYSFNSDSTRLLNKYLCKRTTRVRSVSLSDSLNSSLNYHQRSLTSYVPNTKCDQNERHASAMDVQGCTSVHRRWQWNLSATSTRIYFNQWVFFFMTFFVCSLNNSRCWSVRYLGQKGILFNRFSSSWKYWLHRREIILRFLNTRHHQTISMRVVSSI
jgi:hypothetical protein